MKVIIVGLPYFSKELARNLTIKFPSHTFIHLDTYYSKKDQLQFLFHIITADIVHSINGTLGRSLVLELALKLKKKIVFHWVGTDLIKSTELYDKGMFNPKFITYPTHITDSPWFVEALKKIEITAKFVPLKGFSVAVEPQSLPNEFSVLCYISQKRPEFYGIDKIIRIALKLPDVKFNLVGIESYKGSIPSNINLIGWVTNMQEWINKSVVCLRLPKADGLSFFVLESIALGRYIAYNQDFEYSSFCESVDDFVSYIKENKKLFEQNQLELNILDSQKVLSDFNQDVVLDGIMNIYRP